MPTENPTISRESPTKNPVFFALNEEPGIAGLAVKSDQVKLANLLQVESDQFISHAPYPWRIASYRVERVAHLRGMLEIIKHLVAVEIQVPAMLEGIIRAEIGRVSQ